MSDDYEELVSIRDNLDDLLKSQEEILRNTHDLVLLSSKKELKKSFKRAYRKELKDYISIYLKLIFVMKKIEKINKTKKLELKPTNDDEE